MSKHSRYSLELRSYRSEAQNHQHDFHQLVMPVDGRLELEIDHQLGVVDARHAAVIASGASHGFSAEGDNRFIVADLPLSSAPALGYLPAFLPLDGALQQYLIFLQTKFSSALSTAKSPESDQLMLQLLIKLMMERFGIKDQVDARVAAAKCYIDSHLEQAVTVKDVSAAACLSTRQLNTLFLRSYGCSPQQYLIEQRMRRAKALLADSSCSIQQVAEHCGYSSLASFSDRFRRTFDIAPREFRHSAQLANNSADLAK